MAGIKYEESQYPKMFLLFEKLFCLEWFIAGSYSTLALVSLVSSLKANEFPWYLKRVKRCFKKISRMFLGSAVLRVIQSKLKGVLRRF